MITRERCSRVAAGALCALALGALLAVCGAEEQKLGPHEVLIRVIRINNGTVDAEVRDVPGRGRGLVAFRPMQKNTIAVRLPRTMAFQLAPVTKALEESAELLLEPKHENIAPWFQIYWDSLPARDEFLWRRQPFPTDKLALLQDEALASNLTKALDYTRKYFKQAMTVKGTFEDFAEATALARPCPLRARQMVNAYAFQFHDDQATHVVRTMLPLIDLANHAEAGAPQRPPSPG